MAPLSSRTRPLACAGPAAVAGVLAGGQTWWAWIAALAGLAALASLARRPGGTALALSALLAGLAAGRGAWAEVERLLERAGGHHWARAPPGVYECRLEIGRCMEDPFRDRAWFVGRRPDGTGLLCAWPGRVPAELGPGARVRVVGRFSRPRPPGNPGEADSRLRLASRGIAFVADLEDASNIEILEPAPPGPRLLLERARRAAARRLSHLLPDDAASLATALLLGIRAGLDAEERIRFERTGTMHFLAISGMHVLLLAGAVHALFRFLGVGPRTAAGLTLALAVAYVPLAGGAPPIRRAVTVLTFYGLALVRGRPPDSASALGGAALVLALWQPLDVFTVGFRLSFAAAAGIAILAPAWHRRWGERPRLLARFPAVRADHPLLLGVWAYVARALPVSLAAWCATQGFVAGAFGVLTPLAPLTNVLVAPLLGVLLPLLVLVALGLSWAAVPATLTMRLLRELLDAASTLPGGFWVVAPWTTAAVLSWTIGGLFLRRGPRSGIPFLLAALLLPPARAPAREPSILLLAVGSGQAALVRFEDGRAVLVDGGSRGRPHLWRRVLRPALRAEGIGELEAVVCTHADADHWNALPELLALIPVKRLVVGAGPPEALLRAARLRDVRIVTPAPGVVVCAAERSRLEIVAGGGLPGASRNDNALALVFRAGERAVLLPADRESAGLRELVEKARVEPCDVLVAPHHGARCPSAGLFGAVVRPRWMLVSSLENFADEPTLSAYGARRIFRTWRKGALLVRFPDSGAMVVRAFRP